MHPAGIRGSGRTRHLCRARPRPYPGASRRWRAVPGFGRTLAATLSDLRSAGHRTTPAFRIEAAARRARRAARRPTRPSSRRPGSPTAPPCCVPRSRPSGSLIPTPSPRCRCCCSTSRSTRAASVSWSPRSAPRRRGFWQRCRQAIAPRWQHSRPSGPLSDGCIPPPRPGADGAAPSRSRGGRRAVAAGGGRSGSPSPAVELEPPAALSLQRDGRTARRRRATTRCGSSPPPARAARRSRSRAGSSPKRAPAHRSTAWRVPAQSPKPTRRCSKRPSGAPASRPTSPAVPAAPTHAGRAFLALLACAAGGPVRQAVRRVPVLRPGPAARPRRHAASRARRVDRSARRIARRRRRARRHKLFERPTANGQRTTNFLRRRSQTTTPPAPCRAPWKWEELHRRRGGHRRRRSLAAPPERSGARARARTRRAGERRAGLGAARRHRARAGQPRPSPSLRAAGDRAARRAARHAPCGATGSSASPTLAPRVLRRPEARLAPARRARADGGGRPGRPRRSARRARRAAHRRSTEEPPRTATAASWSPTRTRRAAAAFRSSSCPAWPSASSRNGRARTRCCSTRCARELSADLSDTGDRIDRERLLLRLAVGAAERRVYLSYPRVDVVQGARRASPPSTASTWRARPWAASPTSRSSNARPRRRSARASPGRRRPSRRAPSTRPSTISPRWRSCIHTPARRARRRARAQYLLELNPHLARSLRTRYARWERKRWSELDGIVRMSAPTPRVPCARTASPRGPYSPSALEHFAVCPYRFFLAAIQRLEPRREIAPLEQLDPLTRGKLVHRVQAETLRALARAGVLPLTPDGLAAGGARARSARSTPSRRGSTKISRRRSCASGRTRSRRCAPISSTGSATSPTHAERWHPAHFEFGFGVPLDDAHDPRAVDPTRSCCRTARSLRGAVDLVERRAGRQRAARHRSQDRRRSHPRGPGRRRRRDAAAGPLRARRRGGARAAGAARRGSSSAPRAAASPSGSSMHDERARTQGRQVLDVIDRGDRARLPAARAARRRLRALRLPPGVRPARGGARAPHKDAQPLADLAALRQRP